MAKIGKRPAPPDDFDRYLEQLRAYLAGEEILRDGSPSRIEWLDDIEVPKVPIEVAATGPKVIEIAARRADRICFAVGADTERLGECIARARRAAEAADRDPDALRFGAYLNCVINPDRDVAREAIRGGLSVFAHFSGFAGMDIEALPEGASPDEQAGNQFSAERQAQPEQSQVVSLVSLGLDSIRGHAGMVCDPGFSSGCVWECLCDIISCRPPEASCDGH